MVGGEPTCADPSEDAQVIQWTVISGSATISDPTVADSVITNVTGLTVLQATCTDACGLSDTDTVAINGSSNIEGSGCSLTLAPTSGLSFGWLVGLLGLLPSVLMRPKGIWHSSRFHPLLCG